VRPGNGAARASASAKLTVPAANPLIIAICRGSAALSLRVRLLSMPQDTQARTITALPQLSRESAPAAGQERRIAPARIAIAPAKMRRSTFSRKTSQAIAIVARPSVLSSKEPAAAGVSVNPHISSAGPRTPPNRTIAASQGKSRPRNGASDRPRPRERPPAITNARPVPEPR